MKRYIIFVFVVGTYFSLSGFVPSNRQTVTRAYLEDSVFEKIMHNTSVIELINRDGAQEGVEEYFTRKINRLLEQSLSNDTILIWGDLNRFVYSVMSGFMGVSFRGFNCYSSAKITRHDIIGMALWYSQNIGSVNIGDLQFLVALEIIGMVWSYEIEQKNLQPISIDDKWEIITNIYTHMHNGLETLPSWYKVNSANETTSK